jgi:hypothetical protein
MERTYYAYFDTRTRLFFYLDASDGTRHWSYPNDGYVYEATTLRPVYPPGSPLHWAEGDDAEAELRAGIEIDPATGLSAELKSKKPELDSVPPPPRADSEPDQHYEEEDVPRPAVEVRQTPKTGGRGKGKKAAGRVLSSGRLPPVQQLLMSAISELSKGRSFSDYSAATFKGRKGSDSGLAPAGPLHPSLTDKNVVKVAKDLRKTLVKYVLGTDKDSKGAGYFSGLYSLLAADRRLIDEMYCQVMRCATSQQNPAVIVRSCHVLLLLTTFFSPADSDLCESVSTFLAETTRNQASPPAVASVCCLALFRFEATRAVGQTQLNFLWHFKPGTREVDPKEIEAVITHPEFARHFYFGICLWEIFAGQARQYPDLYVPLVVDTLAKKLWELGAERTEGIFRLPGNSKNIDAIIAEAESTDEFTGNGAWGIHDIASAFKQWYRSVPGAIVQKHEMDRFMQAASDSSPGRAFVTFASKITPISHRFALMYLVGFLRRLARASAATMMTVENLGMVFAPNIIWTDPDADTMSFPKISAAAFLCNLVGHWNVSLVYSDT